MIEQEHAREFNPNEHLLRIQGKEYRAARLLETR